MVTPSDLELTLDRVPVEYPALVKEAVLKINRSDVPTNCATLNDTYCWFLSNGKLLIWERSKSTSSRNSIPTEFPLPPSGLLLSTKCVVIYDTVIKQKSKSPTPAVLAVSPEGVLRHWTSIQSQTYSEKILDLGSEVVLRIELVDPPTIESSASFILTTTSGSVYFLKDESENPKISNLVAYKVAGKEANGIKRRLSSIIFGGLPKENTSLVSNSFLVWDKNRETPLVVCISPDYLKVYNIATKTKLWNLKTSEFFHQFAVNYIEAEIEHPAKHVKTNLVDVAQFRNGLMILMSASHEQSPTLSLYLIYIAGNWKEETPLDSCWSARVPLPDARALFLKSNESILSSLTLCIPQRTAESSTSERTDGIIIVNPFFVQTMFVPDDLEALEKWKLSLCKSINLPTNDQLIGMSISKQYCYIMMLNSGVSSIRLLPKGFSEGSASLYCSEQQSTSDANTSSTSIGGGVGVTEDWDVLSEILSEMVASGLPKTAPLRTLNKAFELFGEKDMIKSSSELKSLQSLSDSEIAATVEQYLYAIIDYTDAANTVETELNAKRILTSRMLLFLKHMGLYERVAAAKILNSAHESSYRCGLPMLAEMNERVAAAAAVWKWRSFDENNSKMFNIIVEKALRTVPDVIDIGLSDRDTFFGRLGFLHHIPNVAIGQLMSVISKVGANKYEHFHSVCELFIAIKDGIYSWRKSKMSITKTKKWWTINTFLPSYRDICLRIRDELKDGVCSDSERSRLSVYLFALYDFYLGEMDTQPNGDQILLDIILMGRVSDGLALAEKHKDFGVLVKITLRSDKSTRQVALNRLKKLFEKDDFEMYLCQYLKTHGLNDILLEQRGERVDAYLDNFKELRFSREISNKQYAKAAYTLMSLADNETKSFKRFTDFLMRAYFCAQAANPGDQGVEEVLQFFKKRLPELKHRKAIPANVFAAAYGNDFDVMMSIDDMLEWNMAMQTDESSTIEGYMRALHLLSDLIKVEDTNVLQDRLNLLWKQLLDLERWSIVKVREDVENKSIFGKLCTSLTSSYANEKGSSFPSWSAVDRLLIIPRNFDDILEQSDVETNGKQAAWIKAHMKLITADLKKQASLPQEAFYRPDAINTGSTSSAVLNWYKPLMELREQKWADTLMESKV